MFWKYDLASRSLQCCSCFKWVHLRCSLLSPSLNSELLEALTPGAGPCCVPASSGDSTVTSSSDSSGLYSSIVQFSSPPLMRHFRPLHLQTFNPILPTLYLLPLLPHHDLSLLAVSLHLLLFLPLLTPSGFFDGMLAVSEPGALNCHTFHHLIPLTLFVPRNPILTHLPLSGFLDFLLCDLIAPTPGLAFYLLMPHTLVAASSFSSSRAYLSLNFLPPLFLCLTPTLIMEGSTSL